jgi:ABC-type uncharacterized transport system involved in gliding motility auxiliary subunit
MELRRRDTMKNNIRESFQKKNFKYGGYATITTAIVVAALIVLNLIVDKLDIKFDLSQNKLFSISEQTTKILTDLNSDIKIISLTGSAKSNVVVDELLDKYKQKSNKIDVEYVDPVLHPNYAQDYAKNGEQIQEQSLIVVSGNKSKVIAPNDLYSTSQNPLNNSQNQSLVAEQKITSAILYVTADKIPVVYNLQGHDEATLTTEISSGLQNENYELQTLDLTTSDWNTKTGDVLLINSPKRDLSELELNKIKDYMSKGGRIIYLRDGVEADMKNFNALIAAYGVKVDNPLVVEGDTQYTLSKNKLFLVPQKGDHEIVKPLTASKVQVITPYAQGIKEVDVKKSSIKIEPLLTTSSKAYGKVNTKATTLEKEAGDVDGPFNVAVAITDEVNSADKTKNPKMVLVSTSVITDSTMISYSAQGNLDFVMNSLGWLSEKEEGISIRAKSLNQESIQITAAQALTVSGIVVVVIPAAIAICGIVICLRRKHL